MDSLWFVVGIKQHQIHIRPAKVSQSVNCENGSAIPNKVNNAYIVFIIISIYQLILVLKQEKISTNTKVIAQPCSLY